jgi:type IV secretion system protein VirD4
MTDFAKDMFRDVLRGDSTRPLSAQRPPQARWATVSELQGSIDLAYDPAKPGKKVLIGIIDQHLIGVDDDRHIMTVASSRAGKSVGLISNLLFYAGSIFATDPKGEVARLTAAQRASMGQRILVLDPFGVAGSGIKKWRASYNPMRVLTPNSPTFIEDAGLIAESLVVRDAAQKDPHWDESACNFIEGVIVHVATAPQYAPCRNLITVRSLLATALKSDALYEAMTENAEALMANTATADIGSYLEGAAEDFFGKTGSELSGVQSTVQRHTRFLSYRAFRSVMQDSDFSLRDLKADPKGVSLYLCFPATRAEISKRWMRIFVNQLIDAMEREETKPAAPVLACLDEFPVLGHMKQLETAAALMASFDVKLWTILQDWNQGKALYGERWETFVANAGTVQFFGNTDLTTTKYISERLGRTPVEVARTGDVGPREREAGKSGRSESIELHPLLTPDEASRLFARDDRLTRQLIFRAGKHPIIAQRVEYYAASGPLARHVARKP